MDFLVSLTYFRAELYFFLGNLIYIIVYFFFEGTVSVRNIYKKLFPEGRKISKQVPLSLSNPKKKPLLTPLDVSVPVSDTVELSVEEGAVLSPEKQMILTELIKHIRTKMARGEFTEARTKIIE